MATGKKAADIFAKTTKAGKISLEVTPRVKGRPKLGEHYQKVTICLYDRHVLYLDKVGLAIQEKTGDHVKRAELCRALVDHAAAWLHPDKPDFDKAVKSLLPSLEV